MISYLFQIEDYQKDDTTIQVQISGKESINISVSKYEKWLKSTDRLSLFDSTGKVWAVINVEAYWERSEFFICQDLYSYIIEQHDLVHAIMEDDI